MLRKIFLWDGNVFGGFIGKVGVLDWWGDGFMEVESREWERAQPKELKLYKNKMKKSGERFYPSFFFLLFIYLFIFRFCSFSTSFSPHLSLVHHVVNILILYLCVFYSVHISVFYILNSFGMLKYQFKIFGLLKHQLRN
jgi:hypothetical protein